MRKALASLALIGLIPLVACSATLKAKAAPERPALDVPPPPPRVIEPTPPPEAAPEPVPDLPPAPAPTRPNRTTTVRPNPQPPDTKLEPKPETAPLEAPTQGPPVQPVAKVPQLVTPQTADAAEAEKNVRATLDRAKVLLSTVNYNPLSNERKKAYNDAKAFIQQAEDAIKQRNYVFAQGVATKAETLANELAGR